MRSYTEGAASRWEPIVWEDLDRVARVWFPAWEKETHRSGRGKRHEARERTFCINRKRFVPTFLCVLGVCPVLQFSFLIISDRVLL